jgi:hypothetical protein
LKERKKEDNDILYMLEEREREKKENKQNKRLPL